jgi:hypothetical protein
VKVTVKSKMDGEIINHSIHFTAVDKSDEPEALEIQEAV